ncbi:hypothetical protein [Hydrogenophaga sp. PAMC20947]|uniref:hypothetical protein n=1 Tax=Hydrogenophaga sp. PAMC20947 TaxID=2565558 RepID=UPI00109E2AD8|nr:hypothetical protein [Hydrogenophaga sp. PAMC20947]QCB44595.1 hypothetical protein E5678_00185 [Hydrogenophaga sp. PAMC20947]
MNSAFSFLEVLERSALSVSLRASEWVYPVVNTLHIVGIALLVGPILILDWRVLRLRAIPTVSVLATVLLPAARSGFALAVVAGSLLFVARPLDYAFNTLFQVKLGCIVLALLNIAFLHRSKAWGLAVAHNHLDWRVRLACSFSLLFWLMTLGLGRLVGYR